MAELNPLPAQAGCWPAGQSAQDGRATQGCARFEGILYTISSGVTRRDFMEVVLGHRSGAIRSRRLSQVLGWRELGQKRRDIMVGATEGP